MGPLFILCIYTFPNMVAYYICATRNKIIFEIFKKTAWEQSAVVKTNWREQDLGEGAPHPAIAGGKRL